MLKFKIVADSSANILSLGEFPFCGAPLKIITSEKEYTDNSELDIKAMVEDLSSYKGKSTTSCPNPEDWLKAFGDAEYIFCFPISSSLSGSYNSALVAKGIYEELYDNRKVFVINTLSTGGEIQLIAEKIIELASKGMEFDIICEQITDYAKTTGLMFMLESMKNLANNGRVSPITAKAAGLLGIRVIGKASDKGELEVLSKSRGQEKALMEFAAFMKEMGHNKGKVIISHCLNEQGANILKGILSGYCPADNILINECRGLCSFYAEKGGLIVGFEKF